MAPFFGAVLAVVWLGKPVTVALELAGLLMARGVWLHVSEQRPHAHTHEVLEHAHAHVHDEHHRHDHDGAAVGDPHAYRHRHEALARAHSPDAHHRHRHRGTARVPRWQP
ncbi:MAG: hypothetical protein ABIX12_06485 [Rubrivivax sp.]